MTREEAIAILQEKYDYCKSFYDLAARPKEDYAETAQYLQALQVALTALRGPTREQVEKVLRGEWGRYCFSDDSHGYQCKNCGVQLDDPVYYRSFCPKCGKAMTDEAVEMVMERLEALYVKRDND